MHHFSPALHSSAYKHPDLQMSSQTEISSNSVHGVASGSADVVASYGAGATLDPERHRTHEALLHAET